MVYKKKKLKFGDVLLLILVNLVYTSVGLFTKTAATEEQFSLFYCLYFFCAVLVMGVYAILWQQVLKRIVLSTAYMFKGLTIVFVMLMAYSFFGEPISLHNIFGSLIIVLGIILFANS